MEAATEDNEVPAENAFYFLIWGTNGDLTPSRGPRNTGDGVETPREANNTSTESGRVRRGGGNDPITNLPQSGL